MSVIESRKSNAQLRRLQTLLLLMLQRHRRGATANFFSAGALMKIDGNEMGGSLVPMGDANG